MAAAFEKVSTKNKKVGLIWILSPVIGLVIILVVFAVSTFILASLPYSGDMNGGGVLFSRIFRMVLGLLGIIDVILIPVGLVIGISYLGKKEFVQGVSYDERSGKKNLSEIPNEIKGWNWGAAGLTWIWGAWHGVWLSLLVFIPVVNIVMMFVLGAKGNEWAWKARQWESVAVFKASQEKWKVWGIVFFVISMLGILNRIVR